MCIFNRQYNFNTLSQNGQECYFLNALFSHGEVSHLGECEGSSSIGTHKSHALMMWVCSIFSDRKPFEHR